LHTRGKKERDAVLKGRGKKKKKSDALSRGSAYHKMEGREKPFVCGDLEERVRFFRWEGE